MSVFRSRELNSELNYYDVIERLLREDLFWGWEALLALLQAELVPSKLVPASLVMIITFPCAVWTY